MATFTIDEGEELDLSAHVYDVDGTMYLYTSAYVEVYQEGNFDFYKYYNSNLE
jgi:hypothetical protein